MEKIVLTSGGTFKSETFKECTFKDDHYIFDHCDLYDCVFVNSTIRGTRECCVHNPISVTSRFVDHETYDKATSYKIAMCLKTRGPILVELESSEQLHLVDGRVRLKSAKVVRQTNLLTGRRRQVSMSWFDNAFLYHTGKYVRPNTFDNNPFNICSFGITAFQTAESAVARVRDYSVCPHKAVLHYKGRSFTT